MKDKWEKNQQNSYVTTSKPQLGWQNYIYVCMCVCVCEHVYVYVYIYVTFMKQICSISEGISELHR